MVRPRPSCDRFACGGIRAVGSRAVSGFLKGLVAVAVAAVVLYGLQRTTPGYGEITSPIPIAGKLGQRIDASAFAIGIAKVHLARAVTTKSVGRTSTFT